MSFYFGKELHAGNLENTNQLTLSEHPVALRLKLMLKCTDGIKKRNTNSPCESSWVQYTTFKKFMRRQQISEFNYLW